ncbi:ATP-binding protein [Nocardia sp. NBC_00508]|uniref:anti-sigma factor n=1 Tax=Nocardia sp. NBC_00508 TaxID=2975992 RepID=UPI002E818533|nr:anti-sigma factor [Nocardia sp. NBC_00508]WUD67379.1 ATP-binding protein [Nocardia sp. NBC_00508]
MRVITCAFGARATKTSTVAVRIPADERHLPLIRGMSDTVCLIADLPLGAAADIRLAINEIAAILAVGSVPGSMLGCEFTYSADRMSVRADVIAASDAELGGDPLSWELVRMLTSSLSISRNPFDSDVRGYPTVIEFSWERGPFDDT